MVYVILVSVDYIINRSVLARGVVNSFHAATNQKFYPEKTWHVLATAGIMSTPANNGTRVWVKGSAVESVLVPRLSFKEKVTRKPSINCYGHLSFNAQGSFTGSIASLASLNSTKEFSDNDSDIGSIGIPSSHTGRNQQWGWRSGNIVESSKGNIVVRLDEVDPASTQQNPPLTLPSSALNEGDVVLANDYPLREDGVPVCPHDLISLTHLHEPSVVECLQHRYNEDYIYTSTGPVLLALNPFQTLRGLYGEGSMKKYWEKAERNSKEILPPHVYAIADNSFRSMMRKLDESIGLDAPVDCDQSILVSGESGAGKTVTTKFVMKYLAALSQRAGHNQTPEKRAYLKVAEMKQQQQQMHPSSPRLSQTAGWGTYSVPGWGGTSQDSDRRDGLSCVTSLSGGGSSNSIEAQVLQSNPILESFGNARTMRNDNSSRFGKFIEIQFTRTGRLVGAQIDVYLLEKVRLVMQATGERNYHIFFEILSGGMDASELRKFFIASTATPDDFRITANGTYDRRDGVSDKETYRTLRMAMNTMKFSQAEQRDVFSITAAILHASNLTFHDLDQECALDDRNIHLEPVCHLFGVTADDLNQALCHYSITAGKDKQVRRSLTVERAEKGLEALLKATYGALFSYLVRRINDSIAYRRGSEGDSEQPVLEQLKPAACIGVLDIFGFESFALNSFEQLCINYCNEALQQQFNAFVLKNEQAEYEREGIDWSFIEFPENQDVLDLIEKRGTGILSILDDQCRAPGTSDKSFALDVYNKCKNQNRFSASRKQTAVRQFSVHHYAGPVEYTSEGFVEKNRDELPKEATDLLLTSHNPFLQLLADIIENSHTIPPSGPGVDTPYKLRRQDSSVVSRATVGGQFRRQLKHLRGKIDKMSPHYIRCLKPNDHLIPDHFDQAAVAEQLRCGGILEAVRVARAGFSNHYPHDDFLRRYRCLGWEELKPKQNGFTVGSGALVCSSGTQADVTPMCKELIKVLCRKLRQLDVEDEIDLNDGNSSSSELLSRQVFTRASWSKPSQGSSEISGKRWAPWDSKNSDTKPPATSPLRNSVRRGATAADWAKVGIQIGKTKIFLRHKAFEALERIRNEEIANAAVKLNAIFRMYLARLAYIDVRDAVRHSMHNLQAYENEYKETKEQDYDDDRIGSFFKMRSSYSGETPSLVDQWASQVRASIHNPIPRNEWGKEAPTRPFKWLLVDGLWTKNHDFASSDDFS